LESTVSAGHWCSRSTRAATAACPLIGGTAEIFGIDRIDEAGFDTHRLQRVCKKILCSAVKIRRRDKIVAGVADVLDGEQRVSLSQTQSD
jgi:hypothetical protein